MKYIKLFEKFLNELNRETYLSAADKMNKYSKTKSSKFISHAIKQEYDNRDFTTPQLLEIENYISNNDFMYNCGDVSKKDTLTGGQSDKNSLLFFKSKDIKYVPTGIGVSFYGNIIYTDDYHGKLCELDEVSMEKKLPRKFAKMVYNNIQINFKASEAYKKLIGDDYYYDLNNITWRDLWNGEN